MAWIAVCGLCGVMGTRVSQPGVPPFEWVKVHIEHFPETSGTMVEWELFCPSCKLKFEEWRRLEKELAT